MVFDWYLQLRSILIVFETTDADPKLFHLQCININILTYTDCAKLALLTNCSSNQNKKTKNCNESDGFGKMLINEMAWKRKVQVNTVSQLSIPRNALVTSFGCRQTFLEASMWLYEIQYAPIMNVCSCYLQSSYELKQEKKNNIST